MNKFVDRHLGILIVILILICFVFFSVLIDGQMKEANASQVEAIKIRNSGGKGAGQNRNSMR